jgi:ketosteroid isomerase-like protein
MSNTLEIGKKLVDLCKQGKFADAMDALYAANIVSIEAHAPPGAAARTEGIAAVKARGEWWAKNHEIHKFEVAGPWPHGDRFIATFKMDVTPKVGPMAGKRFTMEEAALYSVKDGKIVHEEFFYPGM